MLQYTNKHGKVIPLQLTQHARQRFLHRWTHLHPGQYLENVDAEIEKWFANTTRVLNLSNKEQKRSKKHGKDTLYFRQNDFTFVVQGASIITVEISTSEKRHLNKKPAQIVTAPPPPIEIAETPDILPEHKGNLPFFRLIGCVTGVPEVRAISLGKYPSKGVKGDARCLRNDPIFIKTILKRFNDREECAGGTLKSVFAKLGQKTKAIHVYGEVPHKTVYDYNNNILNELSTELPLFKIIAYGAKGLQPFTVNLGSYDASKVKGDAELLCKDKEFIEEMQKRFKEKTSEMNLHSIYVKLGKKGKLLKVYELP